MADTSLPLFAIPIVDREPHLAICAACKSVFTKKTARQRHCSWHCRKKDGHTRNDKDLVCPWCGIFFTQTHNKQLFCSKSCRERYRRRSKDSIAYRRSVQERRNAQQRERIAKMSLFERRVPSFNSRYKARITAEDLEHIFLYQEKSCAVCGDSLEHKSWDIDHIMSVKAGGSSLPENLQLLCIYCNRGKWTMTVEEYVAHCLRVASKARAASRRRKAAAYVRG